MASGRAIPVLHAVTSDDVLEREDFASIAAAVMAAGGNRVAIHLRGARLTARQLYELALPLRNATRATGTWLVINDRLDLALACGADGVQLTSRSIIVKDARQAAPALLVGASVHGITETRSASEQGAHWVVAGNVFRTASHPQRDAQGLEFAASIAKSTTVPVLAIGGITPEHVPSLLSAGVAGIAVIRGVWSARDAGTAVADYLSRYDDANHHIALDHGER
jgi:thiazole tautomerase (transcriptional regulator TenI)